MSVLAFSRSRGVSHTYIQTVESGKYDACPSSFTLARIVKTYNIDPVFAMKITGISTIEGYREDIDYYLNNNSTKSKKSINLATIASMFSEYLQNNNYVIEEEFSLTNTYKWIENKYNNLINYDLMCYNNKPCYVIFIDKLTTIKTEKDEKIIDEFFLKLIGSLVLNHYYVGQPIRKYEKIEHEAEVMIVTSSKKILTSILVSYRKNIHWLDKIDIQMFYCRPKRKIEGPYKLNDSYNYKDDFRD